MKECIICERTIYNAFGESICELCKARHAFLVIRDKYNRGKVSGELYLYYLEQFNTLLKKDNHAIITDADLAIARDRER